MKIILPIFILVLFHVIGFVGITMDPDFINLTPLNLLVSAIVIFLYHQEWNKYFITLFIFIPIAGFMAEVAGVNTGVLFGNYEYSGILGPRVFNTPIIIGLNWLIMIYITGSIASWVKAHTIIKILFASVLLVLMDLALEPFAVKYNLWSWEKGIIPLSNYVTWFFLGGGFLTLYYLFPFNKKNPLAIILYILQLLFFFALV